MPKQLETPNVILQLNQLAQESGITFDQITPRRSLAWHGDDRSATDPFAVEPIQVQFSGSFYDLVTFLQRLRNLVRVDHGHLAASGRLFDVSDIALVRFRRRRARPPLASGSTGVQSTFPHVRRPHDQRLRAAAAATAAAVPGSTDHDLDHHDRHDDHDVELDFSRAEHERRDFMSRKKRMQNVREAKDRRAKKLAIGGAVLLAIRTSPGRCLISSAGGSEAAPTRRTATTTGCDGTDDRRTATSDRGSGRPPRRRRRARS